MDEAVPFLQEAIKDYSPGKVEASLLLADTLLLSHVKSETEQALKLNTGVISQADLSQADRDHALLQRAQILLALGQRAEAQAEVARVSKENLRQQMGVVLQAQVLMRDNKFREAMALLGPLASSKDALRNYPAQASLLMAVCADRLGELENAITLYERTAERFERSHEALAARLGAAEAMLKVGRNEEALKDFGIVLKSIRNPQQFRNRWLTLTRLRETVQQAWSAWLERDCYSEAISLAELMTPAVPREEATELAARACQRWAEHLESEINKLPMDRQAERKEQLFQRWRRCGQAYADLAASRQTLASHTAALWMAADSYVKGHDFANAAERYGELIATRVATIVPQASVQRGQAYLNLDRLDDALADFQNVVTSHPNDAAAFQARYLLGQCQLERKQTSEAEKTWKGILDSTELAPTALEWRRALLALGRLHYALADTKLVAGTNALEAAAADKQARDKAQEILLDAYNQFDLAVGELDEYCDRFPDSVDTLETRYLLAKALQKSSRRFQDNLRSAETDNTRAGIRTQLKDLVEQSVANLQKVQKELLARQAAKQLDGPGKAMLQNCFFDIAAALFILERYEDAIAAYGKAAGRLQQHPESLLAYVQIANCYDRLKKPAEALSTLAQAKILLEQLSDKDFPLGQSRLTKPDWQKWLDWAMKLHD
jgi:tetratricopeptide (TPR) repeat protein